jgi:hypothetical protein
MTSKFTFCYYKEMLQKSLSSGYAITSFEKYRTENEKTIILRHDVDYTLNGVLNFAKIEMNLGITATYCFRAHAHEYNLFSPHVSVMLQTLQMMGHEIGLHHEAMTVARATKKLPEEIICLEKILIELACGKPVKTASEHRDISHVVHCTNYFHEEFEIHEFGFENYSMEPRFFKDIKYLSDSNGVWREGDLTEHINAHDRFQVLVHPDWWFEEDILLKGPYCHGLGN